LFLPVADLKQTMNGLHKAQPFLMALAYDPSLHGIVKAVSFINKGVQTKAGTLDDFDRPMALIGDAFEGVLAGRTVFFSWHGLVSGQPADPRELRRFIEVRPVLDYAALCREKRRPISSAKPRAILGFPPTTG
jgi:uncharacterized protein